MNGILVGPRPQTIPIRYTSLTDKFSAPNAPKTYDHGSVNPNFIEPERVDEEMSEMSITLESYMAMVQECRLEKIAHQVRSDPQHQNLSTIQINKIITEQYVSDFSKVLSRV